VPVRRDPRSPFWQYRFQIRGRKFLGSTKKTNRREAEKVEAVERERAKALIAQTEHARTSLRLDDVAGRYMTEHGQHLAGTNLWGWLGLVLEFLARTSSSPRSGTTTWRASSRGDADIAARTAR
jgi:hypothetical protein